MAEARARLLELRGSRHSERTTAAYASDWKDFAGWCRISGRTALPAEPETVALYLSDLVPIRAVATIERRLASIVHRHGTAGLPSPAIPSVRAVLGGARRLNTKGQRRKAALSIPELLEICSKLASEDTVRSSRDRALILLGFAASFRRSDLASLDLADVMLRDDRVNIALRRSKTDQFGRGRELIIPKAKRASLCPVRALRHWIDVRGTWAGPLFTDVNRRGTKILQERIEGNVVYYALRSTAKRVGLDPKRFGAHSLRAGAITAAADAGADIFDIMALSGHKSVDNVAKYVRRSVVRYPLRKVL